MKSLIKLLLVTSLSALAGKAAGQTLDWGSSVFTDMVGSRGNPIDNLFVIEIGAYVDGFIPDESKVDDWFANGRAFDEEVYNPALMDFTSVASLNDDGAGTNPHATSGFDFQGLETFLWIRKGDDPVEGSEWLLTRSGSPVPAATWEYPNAAPGCFDIKPNLQWSVSDPDVSDIPVWGKQGGIRGSDYYTVTGNYTLQTYTFIPEPTTCAFVLLSASALIRRRRS